MGTSVVKPTSVLRAFRSRIATYATIVEPHTRRLVLLACVAFFLQSAGTVEVVYTIRPSFALLALASVVGFPFVWIGWSTVPRWVLWSGMAVVFVYALAALGGSGTSLGIGRAGPERALVYLADLGVGLSTFGLVVGLWGPGRSKASLLQAVFLCGALAGAYASYQWVAQKHGWPLSDILSVEDSNAFTTGGPQGTGVFGYERVRGTFLEPHFLGAFLAVSLPLAVALWCDSDTRRRRWWVGAAASFMLFGLLFTASVPAWAILGVCGMLILVPFFVLNGASYAAGPAAAVLTMLLLAVPLTITYPGLLSNLTGRSAMDLDLTSTFRTETWRDSLEIWAQRPVLGYGPGQSAVQLTAKTAGPHGPGLASPQGLWAAVLIDAGTLGLGCWAVLLGGLICYGIIGFGRDPTLFGGAIVAAALVAVSSGLMAGDRVELRTWVLLGLLTLIATPAADRRAPVPLPGRSDV